MKASEFEEILEEQIDQCRGMLGAKAEEYASEKDRLSNFKRAAALTEGETVPQALGGMMKKHTVSIYDMIASGEAYPMELWNEKITDHINYLILLKAVVLETQDTALIESAFRAGLVMPSGARLTGSTDGV